MKFTILLITLLSITSAFTKRVDETKDKREALPAYPSTSGHYPSSGNAPSNYHAQASYQPQQSVGHSDAASSISVGAGYSIGGAQPSYNVGAEPSYGAAQLVYSGGAQPSYSAGPQQSYSAGPQQSYSFQGLEGLQSSGLSNAPIKLQPGQGIIGTDLSQIMSQLEQSLNSGALSIQPSNSVAELHVGQGPGAQQFNYATPNLQQYLVASSGQGGPSYSVGTKGLSSYGSTGPVLFNPSSTPESHGNSAGLSVANQNAGQVQGEAHGEAALGNRHTFSGLSLGGSAEGLSYSGSPALSLGHSFGGAQSHLSGLSFGSAGPSLGAISLGGSPGQAFHGSLRSSAAVHGLGLHGNSKGPIYKVSSGKYGHGPQIKSSFKPSSYIGSVPGESSLSGLSHSAPSFSPSSLHSSHGAHVGGFGSFSGPSKAISPLFTRTEGQLDQSAHYASPPATTYGFPSSPYSAGNVQSAAASGAQYYSAKYPSFAKGNISYKVPSGASLGPHSSLTKYSLSSQSHSPSGRYSAPEDASGAYSEAVYDTIKYSEELKPRA